MTGCTQVCNQGRDCTCIAPVCLPPTTTRPAWMDGATQGARHRPRTCHELGVCQGRGDCDCVHHTTGDVDGGNVRLDDPGAALTGQEWVLDLTGVLSIAGAGVAVLIAMNWDHLATIVAGLPG